MWILIINHWRRRNSTKSVVILDSVFWGTRYLGGKFITVPCPPVRLSRFRADSEQLRCTRYLNIQDTSIYTSIDKIPQYQDTLEDISIYTSMLHKIHDTSVVLFQSCINYTVYRSGGSAGTVTILWFFASNK